MHPLDILKYGHLTVMHTLDEFPAHAHHMPNVCGYWSTTDLVAHLGSFELVLEEVLADILKPGAIPTPLRDELMADGQAFNDRQVDELRRGRTFADVLAEYTDSHGRAVALAAQVPREAWRRTGAIPWYGAAYDLEDYVVYTYYAHKREHCGQISVFGDYHKG